MSRPATDRLKVNPPLGRMPTLQFLLPAELQVDAAYQRSIEGGDSQALIRKIAQFWNWDLCQPLVVARRESGELFVIDGQHRLAAARLRGDIMQLPAVVVQYASAADEAASFVHLNQQRRPLGKLDLFKAAVASGDKEACAILEALADAGLTVAPHQNYISWKPGMVANIGGIEACWRTRGAKITSVALRALAEGFAGQVMRYAGTIFPGVAAVCADEIQREGRFAEARFEKFLTMLALRKQEDWRADALQARVEDPNLNFARSSEKALRSAWARSSGDKAARASAPLARPQATAPLPPAPETAASGKRWCDQCDMAVAPAAAAGCKSRWCSLRKLA